MQPPGGTAEQLLHIIISTATKTPLHDPMSFPMSVSGLSLKNAKVNYFLQFCVVREIRENCTVQRFHIKTLMFSFRVV